MQKKSQHQDRKHLPLNKSTMGPILQEKLVHVFHMIDLNE